VVDTGWRDDDGRTCLERGMHLIYLISYVHSGARIGTRIEDD
jgi:hypothetical protein